MGRPGTNFMVPSKYSSQAETFLKLWLIIKKIGITKRDRDLLQSALGIKECDKVL